MNEPDPRHLTRELAMRALYQLDARGEEADDELLADSFAESELHEEGREEAVKLTRGAWTVRGRADALSRELAPAWPPHRQPAVDRSILRLGYYEIACAGTPAAVAINEAVELAKSYSSERSPAFINGVLDRMARHLAEHPAGDAPKTGASSDTAGDVSEADDPFLNDALKKARPTR